MNDSTHPEPRLQDRPEQPYAGIRTRAALTEWGGVNALVGELLGWLDRHGVPPAGPPLYRYRLIGGPTDPFDVEVGIPVAGPVAGDDRVRGGVLPAGRYLVLEHHGHLDSIAASHTALVDWAEAHAIRLTGSPDRLRWDVMFESYRTDPEAEPDPRRWVTELVYLTG
ncbi:MAG TPA: GyrI-like domain-containing protein [Microlunatus sp.]|nr:GyrI-like domain-containing protein [Microlunatus sp.]